MFSIYLGTPETMSVLRSKLGVKIGSTTGYTTEIMAKLRVFRFIIIISNGSRLMQIIIIHDGPGFNLFQPIAAAEGYAPDCYVTSSDVPVARPSPSMIFLNMVKLGNQVMPFRENKKDGTSLPVHV